MAWDLAATMLTGTFADGQTPAFFSDAELGIRSTGNVFTSIGTLASPGTFANVSPLTSLIVRTNQVSASDADYNNDGFVDAADYTIWRNTVGSTTMLDADGTGPSGVPDGVIDLLDYQYWKDHFGETVPGSGSGAVSGDLTVPEPNAVWLLLFGVAMLVAGGRRAGSRRLRQAVHHRQIVSVAICQEETAEWLDF
jgi:hypothetical protein